MRAHTHLFILSLRMNVFDVALWTLLIGLTLLARYLGCRHGPCRRCSDDADADTYTDADTDGDTKVKLCEAAVSAAANAAPSPRVCNDGVVRLWHSAVLATLRTDAGWAVGTVAAPPSVAKALAAVHRSVADCTHADHTALAADAALLCMQHFPGDLALCAQGAAILHHVAVRVPHVPLS
jgi:hypothetical protein